MRRAFLFCILLATGCALPSRNPPELLPNCGSVVFVADGAGDFQAASISFRRTLKGCAWPGYVETVHWSHGFLRIIGDQLDYAHGRSEGCRLAARILTLKAAHPEMQVYLVGHSAGAVVALAAAESLPPGALESMALLSPSLSTFYDLRPALRAVRNHLDVYYSRRDWGYLGIGTALFGTSDRQRASASGRVGFQVYADVPEDGRKLRQHAWQAADWAIGNKGGHYGSYQPGFLRAQVLPFLFEDDLRAGSDANLSPAGQFHRYPRSELSSRPGAAAD